MFGRATMSDTRAGVTVLASSIARRYTDEIVDKVASMRGIRPEGPLLVGFLANEDPAAEMYASWTQKTCASMGVRYELRRVEDKDYLEEAILLANADDKIDGIMVYYPVFGDAQDQYIQQVVSREKDVEGMNHVYYQNLYHNVRFLDGNEELKSILPCTPLAVVKIMEHLNVYNNLLPQGNRLYGKTCVVVNRSEIVGRPLAALLANDGAIVYSVDVENIQEFTRGEGLKWSKHKVSDIGKNTPELLQECCKDADVIITGVPSANYKFPSEYVKFGSVCINFSSHQNFDDSVKARTSLYVPRTGQVTIAMLLRNMLRLIENTQKMKTSHP